MHTITIKEYDSVQFSIIYTDDADRPLSLDGIDIAADVQNSAGSVVCDCDVTLLDAQKGHFSIKPNVAHFAPGRYQVDVLFSQQNQHVSSETFALIVRPAVTAPR